MVELSSCYKVACEIYRVTKIENEKATREGVLETMSESMSAIDYCNALDNLCGWGFLNPKYDTDNKTLLLEISEEKENRVKSMYENLYVKGDKK